MGFRIEQLFDLLLPRSAFSLYWSRTLNQREFLLPFTITLTYQPSEPQWSVHSPRGQEWAGGCGDEDQVIGTSQRLNRKLNLISGE